MVEHPARSEQGGKASLGAHRGVKHPLEHTGVCEAASTCSRRGRIRCQPRAEQRLQPGFALSRAQPPALLFLSHPAGTLGCFLGEEKPAGKFYLLCMQRL